MEKCKKLLSSVVLMSFLLQITATDIGLARAIGTSSTTLAVPSMFDNIAGTIVTKDITRVRTLLSERLWSIYDGHDVLPAEAIIQELSRSADDRIRENTIFNPVHFFNHESGVVTVGGEEMIHVKCRVKDILGDANERSYHAIFQPKRLEDGGFSIDVLTGDEFTRLFKDGQSRLSSIPSRAKEDVEAIERDRIHQVYDKEVVEWAYKNHDLKGFVLTVNAYSEIVQDIIDAANVNFEKSRNGNPMPDERRCTVFLINDEVRSRLQKHSLKIKSVDGSTREVIGYAHASNYSVTIFVEADDYAEITKSSLLGWALLRKYITHEIGVMLGCPVTAFGSKGEPLNEIDSRYDKAIRHQGLVPNGEGQALKPKEFRIVNLDLNLHLRDYAMGEVAVMSNEHLDELVKLFLPALKRSADEKIDVSYASAVLSQVQALLGEYIDKTIAYLILMSGTPQIDANSLPAIKEVVLPGSNEKAGKASDVISGKFEEKIWELAITVVQTVRLDEASKLRLDLLRPDIMTKLLFGAFAQRESKVRTLDSGLASAIPDIRRDAIRRYFEVPSPNFIASEGFLKFVAGQSTGQGAQDNVRNSVSSRDDKGNFTARPGKSPYDALKAIAFDRSLQVEPFTVTDYLAAYQSAATIFGFEPLSESRPDDTARRDIKQLVVQGYLKQSTKRGEYDITGKGKARVGKISQELKSIMDKDIISLIPQELIDACAAKDKKLVVGVPLEIKPYAERVGLTPAGVKVLVSFGVKVLVQQGAGRQHFSDTSYRAAGAIMVNSAEDVWNQADIIKKVKEPLENKELGINELELMRPGQIVYTYLHLASPDCRELTYSMFRKGVTGIAYETIIVEDENGRKRTPALEPMSVIAGNLGGYFGIIYSLWSETIDSANGKVARLTKTGKDMMARVKADYTHAAGFRGVAKGKRAVVLGGGISGVAVARTLLRAGATVTITDANTQRAEDLKRIFSIYGDRAEIILVPKDINEYSPELLERYQQADMLYGCILIPGAPAPQMSRNLMEKISRPELGGKKKTAVINIAIDQGGNFPESHSTYYDNPVYFDAFGNMMFGVANMPDFVGGIASIDLENTNIADTLALALGFEKALELSPRLTGGVNIHDGRLFIDALQKTYPDIPMASFNKMPEVAQAAAIAAEAGLAIPVFNGERYTLLVAEQFYANGELDEHRARYGDRFELDKASGSTPGQFIDNVLAKAKGKEVQTVVLVPQSDDFSEELLKKLTDAGLRFVRVNVNELADKRAEKDTYREQFQLDTYAMMLLVRRIDNSITADSPLYQALRFYVKSHFGFTEAVAIDDYMQAIANNELPKLIKGYLRYRPIEAYEVPAYKNVSAALISA